MNGVAQTDPLLGTPLFGGYEVTALIGEGGMGQVYLLENRELNRKLAAKVLLQERLSNEHAAKRFLAEARAAAAINHRNIIEILDCSVLPDGRHYILMEYLEGKTLRQFANQRPMSEKEILAVLVQVCAGLGAAHDVGIIHRDLKPSNILITPQADHPLLTKILDFGIAKLEDPILAGDMKTKTQAVAGTPNYMSPEQARALRDVDHRADIYALGCIAYELFTGELPFRAHSIGELVFQQSKGSPVPPNQHNPGMPKKWNDLILKAIQADPNDRFQTSVEFANAMASATEGGDKVVSRAAPGLKGGRLWTEHAAEIPTPMGITNVMLKPVELTEELASGSVRRVSDTEISPPTKTESSTRLYWILGGLVFCAIVLGTVLFLQKQETPQQTQGQALEPARGAISSETVLENEPETKPDSETEPETEASAQPELEGEAKPESDIVQESPAVERKKKKRKRRVAKDDAQKERNANETSEKQGDNSEEKSGGETSTAKKSASVESDDSAQKNDDGETANEANGDVNSGDEESVPNNKEPTPPSLEKPGKEDADNPAPKKTESEKPVPVPVLDP